MPLQNDIKIMEKIIINYRYDDYLEANRTHFKKTSNTKVLKIIYIILLILFTLILIGDILANQGIDFFIVFFIVFCLIFIFSEYLIIPLSTKRMFKQQKKYFNNEITLIFNETEIIEISSISEAKLKWIYKHTITPKMLLIYTTPINFIILPKKYCASEEQYGKICSIVANFHQGDK